MTTPKRDLSALRGGLSGLRQPAPPQPQPQAPPQPQAQQASATGQQDPDRTPGDASDQAPERAPADQGGTTAPDAPTEPAARPRSGRRPAKPAAAPAAGKRPIPVYLTAGTKAQLEQQARAADVTLAEWVLDRLDEFYDELGEVFRPAPARRSPLPPRPRIVRPRGEASTTVQLRLTGEELAAIEKLRAQLSAPSRSSLLARVVELGVERGARGSG